MYFVLFGRLEEIIRPSRKSRKENYWRISHIIVDVKNLCKALADRLKFVLPSVIQKSQTAVFGHKRDHTIHTIRDLIDVVNKEENTAAFIF